MFKFFAFAPSFFVFWVFVDGGCWCWKFISLQYHIILPYILQDLNKHAFATQKMVLNVIKLLIKGRITRNIFIENKLSSVKHIIH